LLAGCVVEPVAYYKVRRVEPGGLSTEEIVKLTKEGFSDEAIVEKIRSSGVAAKPTSDQLAALKKEGVSDAVLDAMTAAPVVLPHEKVEYYYSYPYYGYYPYYYYGYPYYYGYGPYWNSGYWYGRPYYYHTYYPHYAYRAPPAGVRGYRR